MTIDKYLLEIGFCRLSTDPFINNMGTANSAGPYTSISLYFDDPVLLSSEQAFTEKVAS